MSMKYFPIILGSHQGVTHRKALPSGIHQSDNEKEPRQRSLGSIISFEEYKLSMRSEFFLMGNP